MRLRSRTRLAAFALLMLALRSGAEEEEWKQPPLVPPPPGALAAAVEWARVNTQPLESYELGVGTADLQGFKPIIGDARVIAFGEGMHDTHEYLAFRNRLFEFLVEEMGVTAIGLETGYTESVAADDYVLGRTEANDAAYTSVFSWSEGPSVESKQLLDWMRAYNQRPTTKQPLHIYGLDLTGGRSGGVFPEARLAPDAMLAYITKVDAPLAHDLRKILNPLLPSFNTRKYLSLSQARRDALTGAISDATGAFERDHVSWVAATSRLEYHRAYQQAVVTRQLDMQFRASTPDDSQSHRDTAMARNAVWALGQQGPQGRLMVFAYNGHVRKGPTSSDFASLGLYLHELIGPQLVVIGSLFNQGAVGTVGIESWPLALSDPSTLNAALRAGAGRDLFYFDTRRLPREGPLGEWVDRGQPLRQDYFEGRPRASFDALVFIDRVTPLRALK